MPNFTEQQLNKVAADIFEAAGVPRGEAEVISELLVGANLAGHDSHGVLTHPAVYRFNGVGSDSTWRTDPD